MNESIPSFFDALKSGDRLSIDAFLQKDPSLVSARDETGLSAVMTALYYMQPEIADLLIDRGAQVDLFEAAASGRTDRLLSLLDQDPQSVNAWSPDGFQPLGLACFFGHTAAVDLLLEHLAPVNTPSKNTMRVQPLHSAVAGQHLEIARLLLEHDADPNARQGEDFTPLHGAAQNGQVEMIRLLLEYGANPDTVNSAGKRPLDYALEGLHDEAARLLEE